MRKISLVLCLMIFGLNLFAQNKIEVYKSSPDSLLQVYRNNNKTDSIYLLSHDAYKFFYVKKDFKKAIKYALVEVNLGRQFLGDKNYKNGLYNLGRLYYYNQEYNESIKCHEKVIDSFPIEKKTYQSYCEIARNYNKLRDYYQSINYYEKGLSSPDILKKSSLYGHYLNYSNVLKNVDSKQSLEKGLYFLKKAEQLAITLNKSQKQQLNLRNTIAEYYKNELIFDYAKAKKYYKQNLKLSLEENDTLNLITTYNNLGDLLNKVNNDSAQHYIRKGLYLSNKKGQLQAKLYFNLAEFYSNKEQHSDAIKNVHKALSAALSIEIDSSYSHVINTQDALLSKNKALVWHILTDKARYHLDYFDSTNNKLQANLAIENIKVADELLNTIRLENFENESKLVWQNFASTTYMLGVRASYVLMDYDNAFYFMEKNKALLLLENISESQVKKQALVKQEILEKEIALKQHIAAIENKLNNTKSNKDSLTNYTEAFYDSKIAYKKFIESLEESAPEYYNYKTPIAILNLHDLQKRLDDSTLVVEYILDETDGFILAISKNKKRLYKLNDVTDLQLKTQQYLSKVSKPFVTIDDAKETETLSIHLYNVLMPFLKESEFKHKNNLVIVPDYTLQNIPFEALKDVRSETYVVTNFQVNYAYSMSFLKNNSTIKRKASNIFTGFAPETFNHNNLAPLKNGTVEITDANSLFKGEAFIDKYATKEKFLSSIGDHKIIHLSTHANANDSISPWIAFKNKKLFLNELYTAKNQAELVVLSACKTSLGDIKKGEGTFSLARGFFYSGANSVVSSLWNVNDKSTQKIISSFYSYLDSGKNKSQALRLAKLDYLKNHTHSELSPYYWSSLILIGDNSQIDTSSNNLIYFGILLLIIILFFFIKRKHIG